MEGKKRGPRAYFVQVPTVPGYTIGGSIFTGQMPIFSTKALMANNLINNYPLINQSMHICASEA